MSKRRLVQTKVQWYTSRFLICPSLSDSQTFKSSSCKKCFLQCACYRCNLLQWMFLVSCDNLNTLFLLIVCYYCEIFSNTILSFTSKQVLWKKSVFYVISTIQYSANTNANAKFQKKVIVYCMHTWKLS